MRFFWSYIDDVSGEGALRQVVDITGNQGEATVISSETSPHIAKAIALTNYCLGQGAYDKKTLSAVLQQLVLKDPIPVLFMRTLIQTLLVYSDLTKYARSILEMLIAPYKKARSKCEMPS